MIKPMHKLLCILLLPFTSLAQTPEVTVPVGGNSWVTANGGGEHVTNIGWVNWNQAGAIFSTYVFVKQKGKLIVAAGITLPSGRNEIKCTVAGVSDTASIVEGERRYVLGKFSVNDSGYIRIDIQGLLKTGETFGSISALQLSGTAVNEQTAFVKNNDGNYFYWGRRGPSVHLRYDVPQTDTAVEWFYNEIVVPEDNDVIGSYFMANGFAEGYFGMQVNSPTERRILFSVWSPFRTDDPKQIPDDKKIILVKKGNNVYTGEFGNEGSGGQSYLRYNWKAGETCKFLLRARPVENGYTNYTAWFYSNAENKWLLIAGFNRPATTTYLKRLYSFLENFDPSTGNIVRKAWYQNQWIRTAAGEWKPLNKITFTADATAQKGYRLDYAGGVEGGKFFLQNCGFFSHRTAMRTEFSHTVKYKQPEIDLSALE
jgi:hypothetical protein